MDAESDYRGNEEFSCLFAIGLEKRWDHAYRLWESLTFFFLVVFWFWFQEGLAFDELDLNIFVICLFVFEDIDRITFGYNDRVYPTFPQPHWLLGAVVILLIRMLYVFIDRSGCSFGLVRFLRQVVVSIGRLVDWLAVWFGSSVATLIGELVGCLDCLVIRLH